MTRPVFASLRNRREPHCWHRGRLPRERFDAGDDAADDAGISRRPNSFLCEATPWRKANHGISARLNSHCTDHKEDCEQQFPLLIIAVPSTKSAKAQTGPRKSTHHTALLSWNR
jgi:hypothetical protein